MARYSIFVLKVPLNTNQATNHSFVSYQTCEHSSLKTNEQILMPTVPPYLQLATSEM